MEKNARIYVAGHRGMVGSAIVRLLEQKGYTTIITRTSSELDLRDQAKVIEFFQAEKPEYVFLAAAKVGGIYANNVYRAEFIYDNLSIQNNLIHQSYAHGAKKLLFLGSSCIYPKFAPQPLKEEHLLTGKLEPTNEPYAIAKIAGIKMCESYRDQYDMAFISAMPTNLYGPNDNYDLNNSHVLPALLRKFHTAKMEKAPNVEIWGTGKPMREFMHVDDMASASVFLMERYNDKPFVNVGTGTEVSIKELAEMIKKIVGYEGRLIFNTTRADGAPRKLMDVSRIHAMGWRHKIPLYEGIDTVYRNHVQHMDF
ncbi:MAG: GDP-L-fucose synthase family protein [Salibacteraceae bacterium]